MICEIQMSGKDGVIIAKEKIISVNAIICFFTQSIQFVYIDSVIADENT